MELGSSNNKSVGLLGATSSASSSSSSNPSRRKSFSGQGVTFSAVKRVYDTCSVLGENELEFTLVLGFRDWILRLFNRSEWVNARK
jgi:hypothetical protein